MEVGINERESRNTRNTRNTRNQETTGKAVDIQDKENILDERVKDLTTKYLGEIIEEQTDLEKELEIRQGYRAINVQNRTFHIYYPSLATDNEAVSFRAQKLNEFVGKFLPLRKIREELNAHGVWTEVEDDKVETMKKEVRDIRINLETERLKYNKQIVQLQNEVNRLENERVKLQSQEKLVKKDKNRTEEIDKLLESKTDKLRSFGKILLDVSYDFTAKYTELAELLAEKYSYEVNSLENQLNNMTLYYKLTKCALEIKDDAETPLWDSVEILMNDKNISLVQKLLVQAQDFWRAGDVSFFGDLPGLTAGGLIGA